MIRLIIAALLTVVLVAAAQGGTHERKRAAHHRHPVSADVPRESTTPPVAATKQDRALDRALNGICRGC